jgi:hypothetical protein
METPLCFDLVMNSGRELPQLDDRTVQRLADRWNDTGLWNDVLRLADHFWSCPDGDHATWHHLLLSVGNFKRQGGARLQIRMPDNDLAGVDRRDRFWVPGLESPVELAVEDYCSWNELAVHISGLGVATTTTLLAALWPGRHVIFDQRVHWAVTGLRAAAGLPTEPPIEPRSSTALKRTFFSYRKARGWIFDTAEATGKDPVVVERALYELARAVSSVKGRTWFEYGKVLEQELSVLRCSQLGRAGRRL